MAMPAVQAASCGTVPSAESSLTSYCIPVTIASSSATSNAQVMLTFNALNYSSDLAANLQNIYVYNSISGKTVPAWIEGNILNEQQTTSLNTAANVIIWINANAISTASDTNYYIGVGATSTDFFVSGNNIGEAPQLSSTYGQYDNGASVFPALYQNFAGTATPSGWTVSGTLTQSNGITIDATDTYIATTASTYGNSATAILDFYASWSSTTGTSNMPIGYGNMATGTLSISIAAYNPNAYDGAYLWDGASFVDATAWTNIPSLNVYSLYSPSTSSQTGWQNYANSLAGTLTSSSASQPVAFSAQNGGTAHSAFLQWIRIRTYPPSGVMPATTFGAAVTNGGSSGSATLSISANPITYGQSVTISATCGAGDSCAVDYPSLGTAVATGTGSASYSIPAFGWAAGTYSSFYANDITAAVNSVGQSLTINKNSSYSVSLTYRGASVSNGQSFPNNLNASGDLVGSVATHNNQLTASLEYDAASSAVCSSATSCTYNSVWNDKSNWGNWTAGNANYTSKYINISIGYVPYVIVTAPSTPATNYETETDLFDTTINVTKYATTANDILYVNGAEVNSNSLSVSQGPQTYQLSYQIPLLTTNDITDTFNSVISLALENGTTINPQYSSLSQSELFNYIPSVAEGKQNIIQGENQSIGLNVLQVKSIGLANVSSDAVIGNQTITFHVSSQYSYYADIHSFINSRYDLSMPVVNTPVTVTATVPVKLSLGSQYVWRNQSETFGTYLESLVSCGSPNTIAWNFYNASNPSQAWPANVLFTGSFQVFDNLYQSNTIPGSDAGLSTNAIANHYTTCIYPSFGQFQASGSFTYSAANTATSNYYLQKLQVSNSSQNINLYLESLPDSILYEIAVENVTAGTYISSLVQEMLYDSNTNSSVLVDEFYTQAGSGTYTYLNNQWQYRFIAYTPNYPTKLLAVSNWLTAAPCSTTACPFVINVGNFTVKLIQSMLNNFKYSCTNSPGTGNTMSTSCSFTSINGTSYNTSLLLQNNTAGILNNTVCQKYLVTGSGSLSCTASHINNTQYSYFFRVFLGSFGWHTLASGTYGRGVSPYGNDGVWLAMMVIIAMSFLFLTKNPTVTIILFDVGFTIVNFIGLINAGTMSIGFMWVASAFIIYILNRR